MSNVVSSSMINTNKVAEGSKLEKLQPALVNLIRRRSKQRAVMKHKKSLIRFLKGWTRLYSTLITTATRIQILFTKSTIPGNRLNNSLRSIALRKQSVSLVQSSCHHTNSMKFSPSSARREPLKTKMEFLRWAMNSSLLWDAMVIPSILEAVALASSKSLSWQCSLT